MKHNKTILILTHPLGANYGGIMQAYALQKSLAFIGSDVATSNLQDPSTLSWMAAYLRYYVRRCLHYVKPAVSDLPPHSDRYIMKYTNKFIKKHIKLVPRSKLNNKRFLSSLDAVVVGSDQVWRQSYVQVDSYMLDFTEKINIKRISYAASFGTADLSEYSSNLIAKTEQLAKTFDAISVREDSGIDIVKKHWHTTAQQHVDPTLLLNKEDYQKLIDDESVNSSITERGIFVYVLDKNSTTDEILSKVAAIMHLSTFKIMPPKPRSRIDIKNGADNYQLPPVTRWLKSFSTAEFIVTDSFHGVVFSIIFNKPFLAIGNQSRGLTRFTSLLRLFGLEDRLVNDKSEVTDELIKGDIEWERVNSIMAREKQRSHDYLSKHLNGEGWVD